jgi:AcrR family transcriptional regulator
VDRRLTARGKLRRQQLLDEATRLFAERGYHATAVADVVDAVGVGKGVFYWYFESKEALFLELLGEAQLHLEHIQLEAANAAAEPVRRVELGIRGALRWLEGHRDVLAVLQLAATEDRFLPSLRAGQERAATMLAAHLKEGIVLGGIPDGDPLVLAHAVLGAVEALARTFLSREGAWDQGIADTAVAFCVGGLLSPRGAAAPS